MKITKRQLKRIIKEEKRQLLEQGIPSRERTIPAHPDIIASQHLDAVRDAILELFAMSGEVRTIDVFDHLKMNGMHQDEIDIGLDALGEEY